MDVETTHINEHIAMIDHGLLNIDHFGATYVVQGDTVALIETGTSLTAGATLAGLAKLKIDPAAVHHILLTHVHMDHAGGAGVLAQALPNASVYIHSLTAEHLIDPSRLLPSVQRAVGDLWSIYGTIVPLPAERVLPAEDLRLDLGRSIVIEALATPGHSPDHLAFWEAGSGSLWTGDALGIVLPHYNVIYPMTPPPGFDLAAQLATVERIKALPLQQLLISHFGPAPQAPATVIELFEERLGFLSQTVQQGLAEGAMPTERLLDHLAPASYAPSVRRVLQGMALMNIAGMRRYLERQPRTSAS